MHFDPPSSLIGGEDLLARLYDAIRSSSSRDRFELPQHACCWSRSTSTAAPTTTCLHRPRFRLTRQLAQASSASCSTVLGVRIPTLAISAWIPEHTVVSDVHLNTSLLATMRERWNLGAPLTARDASAPSFAGVLSLSAPRPQEDWPDITPRPVPAMPESLFELDAPLGDLGFSLVSSVVALAQAFGKSVPDTKPDPSMPGAQAIALAREALGDVFPLLRGEQ